MKSSEIANNIISVIFIIICSALFIIIAPVQYSELTSAIKNGTITTGFSQEFEAEVNNSFPQKNFFVDLNGLFHRITLQREMNEVVLLKDGYGTQTVTMEGRSEEMLWTNGKSLAAFNEWLADREKNLIYVQVPWKTTSDDLTLPQGVVEESNYIGDTFVSDLESLNVPCLNLNERIKDESIDRHSLFLKTEHHWSPQGGFWAFQEMSHFLMDNYGEAFDETHLDVNNYDEITYENGSLGYYGQRTGAWFVGYDDFTVMIPKFDTKQSCYIVHYNQTREGTFEDAIFDKEKLNLPQCERGLYGMYIGGDYPLVIHHSETASNSKKLMIFIDSFGTIPESYFTTIFQDVIAVDLRWIARKQMGFTACDLVEEYDPDYVIVTFNPNQLGGIEKELGLPQSEQFIYGVPQ